jgi:hypothetical protein
MTLEALPSGATALLASAVVAMCFVGAGVASEAAAKTEAVQLNPPPVARHVARKLGKITPRGSPRRLLAASGKDDRAYRSFPLLLGISF